MADDDEDVRRLRLAAQGLEPRCAGGAVDIVRRVCGVQAQDARAAALSVRARSEGLTEADVTGDAGLVRTWAWRGTLHLLAADDVAWVLPLVAPGAIRSARARWRQLGLDEGTYVRAREALTAALAPGARTRAELREALAAAGIDASGQRLPHLVRRAALDGLLHHPLDGTFAAFDAPPEPVAREAAVARLARRYLAAFGPAGPRDLAAWSGLPAADVKAAWGALAGGLVAIGEGWVLGDASRPDPRDAPVVRLLPAFDTYLLGYRDRRLTVAPADARRVRPGGGWLHPVLLVDGRAAGTWRVARSHVTVDPFAPLPPAVRTALDGEAAAVERFLAS